MRNFVHRVREELLASEWDLPLCPAGLLSAVICEVARHWGRKAIDVGALDVAYLGIGVDHDSPPVLRVVPWSVKNSGIFDMLIQTCSLSTVTRRSGHGARCDIVMDRRFIAGPGFEETQRGPFWFYSILTSRLH